MTIESICFETQWDEKTIHLALPETTLAKRVSSFAIDLFSILFPPLALARYCNYKLNHFANRVSLPAAHYISEEERREVHQQFNRFWYGPITEENKLLRDNYEVVRQIVRTPDGADLHAVCLQYKGYTSETSTVIFFNGNFQLSAQTPIWILEESMKMDNPCNFVLFDYRGVGISSGQFREARDLLVDGYSIVSWVKNQIGTLPENIHFYGFSLGGAISTLTKSLDPENLTGRLINDRSFASSSAVISSRYGSGYIGKLVSWLFDQYGYSATPSIALAKASGEKLVIYHPYDTVIPEQAGMLNAVSSDVQVFRLEPKEGFEEQSRELHHVASLDWHKQAVETVMTFLFPSSAVSRTMGIA
jgi:pimeloyl-ACP methyl ester carboxylesterase